ncbi:MAG: hypothetical protein DMG68_14655 [Acidobacteria bacterium]|nr:MAG: hypothetical protein DMG68_14655 [Acidobacteriota bacterium]
MRRLRRTVILTTLCLSGMLWAQNAPVPLDGPKRIFHDDLLEQLAGKWRLSGTIMGRNAEHDVQAEWVLNHQFLRVHEKEIVPAKTDAVPYEAIVMIGYDNASERYVAHWMDVYGGRVSETLGYGRRAQDAVEFVFEYPDGPFRTTFRWLPDKKQWQWLMKTKNASGIWADFGSMTLFPVQ